MRGWQFIFLPLSLSWVFFILSSFFFLFFFGVFSVSGTAWENMYLHVFIGIGERLGIQ